MDLVAIGAHPDDIELFAGGTIAKCARNGWEVGIITLTRGEMASRGTPGERLEESREGARILGVEEEHLAVLDLGDTLLENTAENRKALIRQIRRWQPRIWLYLHPFDRHPDHRKASKIVEDAFFYCHLANLDVPEEPYYPGGRFRCFNNTAPEEMPSFFVDVSDTFETKLEALRAHRSQFYNPEYQGVETYISSRDFFEHIKVRARYFGGLAGVRYAEAFSAPQPLLFDDPLRAFLPHRD
ncbi:MAG: bacillithiol biosynthesis deacetylase BshB1 [Candidatus Sumerlaeota bacterium]